MGPGVLTGAGVVVQAANTSPKTTTKPYRQLILIGQFRFFCHNSHKLTIRRPMSDANPISPDSKAQSFIADKLHSDGIEPGLYIVATPIGNLRDITLRALDILSAADIILAEDTRHTQKLLSHFGISARLVSYYDHNAAGRIPMVLEALEAGKTVAQVSDAGTPLVSDPGFKLVRAAIEAGHNVFPLPGASSPLAALMAAGLPSDSFTFAGFLPPKSSARKTSLAQYRDIPGTLILFETGRRIGDVLIDIQEVLGDRPAVLARELTKTYEEFRRAKISGLIDSVKTDPPKGEIVLLIGSGEAVNWSQDQIDAALKSRLSELGVKRASAEVAELSGWAKRDVYQRALELK